MEAGWPARAALDLGVAPDPWTAKSDRIPGRRRSPTGRLGTEPGRWRRPGSGPRPGACPRPGSGLKLGSRPRPGSRGLPGAGGGWSPAGGWGCARGGAGSVGPPPQGPRTPGDEPQYLLTAISLAEDHDL